MKQPYCASRAYHCGGIHPKNVHRDCRASGKVTGGRVAAVDDRVSVFADALGTDQIVVPDVLADAHC